MRRFGLTSSDTMMLRYYEQMNDPATSPSCQQDAHLNVVRGFKSIEEAESNAVRSLDQEARIPAGAPKAEWSKLRHQMHPDSEEGNGKPPLNTCYHENPMNRVPKMQHEIVLEDETPSSDGTQQATVEEQQASTSSTVTNDRTGSKLNESPEADAHTCEWRVQSCMKHTIGTWNVRSMNHRKLEIVKQEMERIDIAILGVSELKWMGMGHFESGNYTIFYAGYEKLRRNGVALIVRSDVAKAIKSYNAKSERVISMRFNGRPINITIIQVYAPMANTEAEELERFYAEVQEEIDHTPKQDVLIIMGDWNATVGNREELGIVGRWGLGYRNEAGERLVQFCEANNLFIANTCFQQPKRRLYTWTSPNGQYRNQIDYIIGRRRWKSSILSAKTRPGSECGTDHKLLISEIKVKLKKNEKAITMPKYNFSNIPEQYKGQIRNRFEALNLVDGEPEERWSEARDIIREECKKTTPLGKRRERPQWMDEETLKKRLKTEGKQKETKTREQQGWSWKQGSTWKF
ncbi:craniofacial development protein 2-like isoform X1 [Rhineura floridana]|uniref:craniofacial development protein 2-like isoform X1 n=1 Tax=Rhineura floridana TaxID=261503 RepID=UPI002AC84CCD|nr:craniofacial development protein 2-like isoform X1 [Rhineura floridana]